ncbi:hypothetical protein HanIR_Chr05g0209091 [Helianthus annuus]|nr:hypothetical protein HanIR_Chr05g0209091 [Helianthus annuus]
MFNSTLTKNEDILCPVDGAIMITGLRVAREKMFWLLLQWLKPPSDGNLLKGMPCVHCSSKTQFGCENYFEISQEPEGCLGDVVVLFQADTHTAYNFSTRPISFKVERDGYRLILLFPSVYCCNPFGCSSISGYTHDGGVAHCSHLIGIHNTGFVFVD